VERVSRSDTSTSLVPRRPTSETVAKDGGDEAVRGGCRGGSLKGGDKPHAAGQEFDVDLQEVMTEAGQRKSMLMQPLRRVGRSASTRWHVVPLCTYASTSAGGGQSVP
jgi:hypothetical protein